MTIYSGHDYTLLTLFGLMKSLDKMNHPVGFGSYCVFELWSQLPETVQEESNDKVKEENSIDDRRILRLKYNPNPFYDNNNKIVNATCVQMDNEFVIKDYTMLELQTLLELVNKHQTEQLQLQQSPNDNQESVECHTRNNTPSPSSRLSPRKGCGDSFSPIPVELSSTSPRIDRMNEEVDNSYVISSEDNG